MAKAKGQSQWLNRYANNFHAWRQDERPGQRVFKRPAGLVEGSFDTDGLYYGGRADMHSTLTLEISSTINDDQLRQRIVKAWSVLRLQHPLLFARVDGNSKLGEARTIVIQEPTNAQQVLDNGANSVITVHPRPDFDVQDFRKHMMNAGRIIDTSKSLSQLFILPLEPLQNGNYILRLVQVTAHMIADGLTLYNWTSHFIDLLNQSSKELDHQLSVSLQQGIDVKLPPAQENLYPPIPGSRARQRWFWAIQRILRHCRKPIPQGFINPLRRQERKVSGLSEAKYPEALDYSPSHVPPMQSGHCLPSLSPAASKRLIALSRAANCSVGAGLFALHGLVMMELEEELHPEIPLAERAPFVTSFPLNPRPFFNYAGPHDSCMLAFSDGIVFPFLPSDTNLEGRLRLMTKSAHRQLRSYQKKLREPVKGWDPHSALRMIADSYLTAIERDEAKRPRKYRTGINPQGVYPANVQFFRATCGVSSVGSVKSWVAPGKHNLDDATKDVVMDYRSVKMGVRARENEFLIGSSGDSEGIIHFNVSYDASGLDERLVEGWKRKMETILEIDTGHPP
jgi:hypothetical protein